jgi:hypothetical protein
LRMQVSKTRRDARRVFLASLAYLPLLLTFLLVDSRPVMGLGHLRALRVPLPASPAMQLGSGVAAADHGLYSGR